MALKRKPPTGNVRRIAPIGKNLRYTIANKVNETVQCKSFQERKLTLFFDRDKSVQEYRSQPERFPFTDSNGTPRTYVPLTEGAYDCCPKPYRNVWMILPRFSGVLEVRK